MKQQQTRTVPAGLVLGFMEARLAAFKTDFPQWKRGLVADACRYGDTNRNHGDRRPAAYQIARNLAAAITEMEDALAEAKAIQASSPELRDMAITLPVIKPSTGYVYFAVRHADKAIKIGFSKNPQERVKSFSAGSGPCTLVAEKRGSISDETALHRHFKDSRIGGEWFAATPELLDLIRKWPLI